MDCSAADEGAKAVSGAGGGPGCLAGIAAAPLLAASFLTVLPVPVPASLARGGMGWAVACFPLAGAALGVGLAALDRVLSPWLPSTAAAALLLAVLLLATGALHLDGLMDSFDGLFGGRDRAGRLAIMRDSRVGSYGVAAAASVLLVEYGSLVSLPADARASALVVALCLSRWAMAAALWLFPAASSSGLAAGLKPRVGRTHGAAATVAAVAVAVGAVGWGGLALGGLACLVVALGGRVAAARLGGVTGDVCGGLGQLVEATVLVACTALAARS